MSEICFIEARPRIVATGAEEIVRLAGGGSDTPYHRDGQHYLAGLVDMPRFKGAFGYDDNGYTGGTVPTSGALDFLPGDSATVTALTAYYWRDAPITVDTGEESGPLSRRLTGIVADIANNDGTIALTLVDPSKRLDKPLLGTGFAGTGGIEGPAEVTGQPKARSWGRVFNVPGTLIDKVNNIYAFGDPACALQAFDDVYDKGREGPLVVVAWAGSIAATFAALQAAAAPQGGAAVAPSIACVKWWTVPAGPLTADIRGETAGGYAETVVSIAARMLAAVGGPAIANQAAADALRPAPCGIHVATASDTVAQALDRLFLGSSLYWVLQPDGTIRIGQWAWGAPVASLQAIFIGRERQLPPIKSRKVGYKRNHRVHGEGEISAAVIPAGDIVYEDGTPIEAWKPAEPGAQSNKPPTDKSPAPPLELPPGTVWFDAGGHPYRFTSRPWVGADGQSWLGGDGGPWLGGGYEDVQDQLSVVARNEAEAAQAAADAAQGAADAANVRLSEIASDNLLTPGEKPSIILDVATINGESAGIVAQAVAFGVVGEKAAYETSLADLTAYLATLTAPTAWNNLAGNTAIVGATFRAAFASVYATRQTLLNKIAAVAKARADAGYALAEIAKGTADAAALDAANAQNRIAAIVADGTLDKSEKPELVLRYNSALSEQPGIQNNAVYYAIVAEKAAYDAAVAALTAYLTGLAPAYNDYGADTAIDRAAFNAVFKSFYDARQALLDKIAVEAGRSTATMTLAPAQSILCDYLGAPKAGQLPRLLINSRKRGNAVVDAAATWAATFPASVTGTIDTASANTDRGDITVTAFNGAGGPIEISVTSTHDGLALNGKIAITPVLDAPPPPPPPSGTVPTSAQSSVDQTNATSAYLSSGVIIGPVRAPASGQIKLEAILSFTRSANGENDAYGKWGYSTSGSGPFTDAPAGEMVSVYGCRRQRLFDPDEIVVDPGALSVNQTLTGLTSGTDYYFEFRPRKGTNYSGVTTAVCTFSGLKKATQA